jgi:hypothetical protein
LALVIGLAGSDCRRSEPPAPPLATPSLTLGHEKVPLGSPVDMTFKFVVAAGATFSENYRVFVHVVDADEELIWADDHDPPVPTSQWKPGQTVEYTRTVFAPIYPYVGEASIQIGLYSLANQKRVPLAGEDIGQRAYRVARMQLAPQTENVFVIFKDGWHQAETAEHNATVEWHWTKKQATLAFKNPKKDCVFYLQLDNPGGVFEEQQEVTVGLGSEVLERFTVTPKQVILRKIPIPSGKLGSADLAQLTLSVDKTFVPSERSASTKDPRELGVRVFHAFIDQNP